MQGKVTFLLAVAAVAIAVPSSRKPANLLGTFTNSQNETVEYWWIMQRLTYELAELECIDIEGGLLASFETKEEEDLITGWIIGNRQLERTWVGSKWDGNSSYIWDSGVPFRDNVNWWPGEPRLLGNNTRVAFYHYNTTAAGFISQTDGNILHAVCEVYPPDYSESEETI